MAAPLTIEQMILNHNIGVNISDATTLKGYTIDQFLMVGAKFDASAIVSGTFTQARLPAATQNAAGIVQLSDSVSSNSSGVAASSAAVYSVKLEADGKANLEHTHSPSDIVTGAFTATLTALSSLSLNTGIIRNIFISDIAPTAGIGKDGDIYLQYQD